MRGVVIWPEKETMEVTVTLYKVLVPLLQSHGEGGRVEKECNELAISQTHSMRQEHASVGTPTIYVVYFILICNG